MPRAATPGRKNLTRLARLKSNGRRTGRRLRMLSLASICGLALVSGARGADAQSAPEDPRARQSQLFEALSADPANLELMFAYALASLQIEDYEAAISTLERMLFYNPSLSRVKLELAVAYYRLGVYDIAGHHFNSVLADEPPQDVVDRIQPFLAQIQERTAIHSFSGFVEVGGVYSSNANFGPPDREVKAEFFPGGIGLLSEDSDEAADFGARFNARVAHRYDMQQANDDAWMSALDYNGVRYRKESAGDLDALRATTGPRLAIDDEAFGLKLRPTLGLSYVRSDNESLYFGAGPGLELSETLDSELAAYGGLSAEWREFFNGREAFDGVYASAYGGFSYTQSAQTSFDVTLLARTDRTSEASNANTEIGVRFAASHAVDLSDALGGELFPLPWRLSAFGQVGQRYFDEPDVFVDADLTRQDTDLRVGGRVLAPFSDAIAGSVDVSYYRRMSNIRNFDLENLEVGVSLIHVF